MYQCPNLEDFSIFLHFCMVPQSIASHQDAAPVGLILRGLFPRSSELQDVPSLGCFEHTELKHKKGTLYTQLVYDVLSLSGTPMLSIEL